jgi:hypothetical protein
MNSQGSAGQNFYRFEALGIFNQYLAGCAVRYAIR